MKNCVCQSCGMPLYNAQMYGTGKDGLRIEDYCIYCYQNGEFTEALTMEGMIQLCARYVKGNTKETAIANMRKQFPELKRWARKEETQHEYHKSINRVIQYIQEHLDETISLKTLAETAGISPYHFHRIFKNTIGESAAAYVQRLRLEFAAEQLKNTVCSLGEIALQSGYSSEQALSRAFKKHFRLPPKAFKASFFDKTYGSGLIPRICKTAPKHIITLREEQPDDKSWKKLYAYAVFDRRLNESAESLEIIRNGIFHPALTVKEPAAPNSFISPAVLSGGLYAVFTHKGSSGNISGLYNAVVNHWLAGSKYICRQAPAYVKYLNSASQVPAEKLLAEIYLPVIEKSKAKTAE